MLIKHVKPEHIEILREYLSEDVILVYPEAPDNVKTSLPDETYLEDYNHCCEPDVSVEKVTSSNHHAVSHCKFLQSGDIFDQIGL